MRILVVEDEQELSDVVARLLQFNGFVVDRVYDLADAVEAVAIHAYPLIILDRRLPDGDGLTLIDHFMQTPRPRILALSALDEVGDRVTGLAAGADDYLGKPFAAQELVARVNALLRRPEREATKAVLVGRLRYDPTARTMAIGEVSFVVPRREHFILEALLRRNGQVVTRAALENAVYSFDEAVQSNTLESQISRLRTRLTQADARVVIHTVRGIGYLLKEVKP